MWFYILNNGCPGYIVLNVTAVDVNLPGNYNNLLALYPPVNSDYNHN
jgi:hypothetical protein